MLSSITPLGERGRGNRWWLTVTAFIVAATFGGALMGTCFGLLGWPVRTVLSDTATAIIIVVAGTVAVLFDAGVIKIALPRWRRQVNEDWLTAYRGWVYGAGFGFQLGAGLLTIVTAATTYLLFLLTFLSGSPTVGAILGGTFGLVRGLTLLASARIDSPEDLVRFHKRLNERAPLSRFATIGADALVVGAAALAVLR